jgi:hypothetical protein
MKNIILLSFIVVSGIEAEAQWTGQSSSSDLTSPISRSGTVTTSGVLNLDGVNGAQIRLGSEGTYYGKIGNPSNQVWSLGWGGATTDINSVLNWTASGNVGIGTASPENKLDIINQPGQPQNLFRLRVDGAPNDYFRILNATGASGQFIPNLYGHHTSDNRQALYITGSVDASNDSGVEPIMVFDSRISNSSTAVRPLFAWDSYGNRKMTLSANGNLGIGTTDPGSFKLAVNGKVWAQEVQVALSNPGPDYVFEKDYNLMSLEEIKAYIDKHKHLPEVPSAKEMETNGVNLSEMNMMLLKKVEELTLHVIELKKEVNELKGSKN